MTVQALFHTHTYHAMLDALEGIVIDHDPADDGMLRTRLTVTHWSGIVAGVLSALCILSSAVAAYQIMTP